MGKKGPIGFEGRPRTFLMRKRRVASRAVIPSRPPQVLFPSPLEGEGTLRLPRGEGDPRAYGGAFECPAEAAVFLPPA